MMDKSQIEEYRQPMESDKHWALRKEFIQRYKNDFTERTLLRLAQVYSDIEIDRSSHPFLVMQYARELRERQEREESTQEFKKAVTEQLANKEERTSSTSVVNLDNECEFVCEVKNGKTARAVDVIDISTEAHSAVSSSQNGATVQELKRPRLESLETDSADYRASSEILKKKLHTSYPKLFSDSSSRTSDATRGNKNSGLSFPQQSLALKSS